MMATGDEPGFDAIEVAYFRTIMALSAELQSVRSAVATFYASCVARCAGLAFAMSSHRAKKDNEHVYNARVLKDLLRIAAASTATCI